MQAVPCLVLVIGVPAHLNAALMNRGTRHGLTYRAAAYGGQDCILRRTMALELYTRCQRTSSAWARSHPGSNLDDRHNKHHRIDGGFGSTMSRWSDVSGLLPACLNCDTVDRKDGICAVLRALDLLDRAGLRLKRDLAYAFTGDEESGELGGGASAGIAPSASAAPGRSSRSVPAQLRAGRRH